MNELIKAGKHNNYHYNPKLKDKARYLRKHMTKAEIYLWKLVLCQNQMRGLRFNRQRPLMNYIVDFFCKKLMLIIEIDGYTHLLRETSNKDDIKQRDLESVGFKVLRYSDEDVLNNIHSVIQNIENTVKGIVQ